MAAMFLSVRIAGIMFYFCVIQPTLAGIRMSQAGEEREAEGEPVLIHLLSGAHLALHVAGGGRWILSSINYSLFTCRSDCSVQSSE